MTTLEDAVRMLAYELWESAGRPNGRSEEFWFLAEAQMKSPEPSVAAPAQEKPALESEGGAPVAEAEIARPAAEATEAVVQVRVIASEFAV